MDSKHKMIRREKYTTFSFKGTNTDFANLRLTRGLWLLILFISAFISSVSAQIYIGDSAVITVAGDAMIYDGTSHSDETNTKEKDLTVGKSEKTAAESKDFIAEIVNKTEKKQIKKVTVKADTPKKVFTPILPRKFFSVSANDCNSCTINSNESIPIKENGF